MDVLIISTVLYCWQTLFEIFKPLSALSVIRSNRVIYYLVTSVNKNEMIFFISSILITEEE